MSLGDVHIMFYGRPEKVSPTNNIREQSLALNHSIKFITITFLTLFRMGFFGAAHGCGRAPLPKIRHTYHTMMKLGSIIP